MDDGITRIVAERKRQIEAEGYDKKHDAAHDGGQLADAAACYADLAGALSRGARVKDLRDLYLDGRDAPYWPFEDEWFKPSENPIRNLEKAGALIAAEIDRLLARGMTGTIR